MEEDPDDRAFIGRRSDREKVKTKLLKHGSLLVYGQPLVGKRSLAIQVAKDILTDSTQKDPACLLPIVDCSDAVDWPGVVQSICTTFSLDDILNEAQLVKAILEQNKSSHPQLHLFLLLKLHRVEPRGKDVTKLDRFLHGFASSNVKILMTSRRKLEFQQTGRMKIDPMTLDDMSELLHHEAPEAKVDDFKELLHRYCEGLPPLVLQMAELVRGGLAFTAPELTEALVENPGLLIQGLEHEGREIFSQLSPECQDQIKPVACLLDGSFSVEHMKAAVGQSEAKTKGLAIRLQNSGNLIVDDKSRSMRVDPFVAHYVRKYSHMETDDRASDVIGQARLRVVTLLGQVLTKAERDFLLKGHDTVYGHMQGEWPQLQQVFRQAIHANQDSYQAFLQVALKADRLLARCFPHEALEFYNSMASAAVRFGSPRDHAVIQGLIGMSHSIGVGTGWNEALRHFELALPVLEKETRSPTLLRLLCDIGFTYYRLNNLPKSEEYLRKAVAMYSNDEYVEANPGLVFHLIRARYLLSLPLLFQGKFSDTKNLLKDTVELLEQCAPFHPCKPMLINSLGLVYERSGEDLDEALKYYRNSLAIRRQYQDVAPSDLTACLNNIGMQYVRRGQPREALQYLEECLTIRLREPRWHFSTGLTYQHIGCCYLKLAEYQKAVKNLEAADEIYQTCTPKHESRCKATLTLVHARGMLQASFSEIQQYLEDICKLAKDPAFTLSDDGIMVMMSTIEHYAQLEGWVSPKVTALIKWAQELLSKYRGERNERVAAHHQIVTEIFAMNETGEDTHEQIDSLTSRIVKLCQPCLTFPENADVTSLWKRMEEEGHKFRSVFSHLRRIEVYEDSLGKDNFQKPGSCSATDPKDKISELSCWNRHGHFGNPTVVAVVLNCMETQTGDVVSSQCGVLIQHGESVEQPCPQAKPYSSVLQPYTVSPAMHPSPTGMLLASVKAVPVAPAVSTIPTGISPTCASILSSPVAAITSSQAISLPSISAELDPVSPAMHSSSGTVNPHPTTMSTNRAASPHSPAATVASNRRAATTSESVKMTAISPALHSSSPANPPSHEGVSQSHGTRSPSHVAEITPTYPPLPSSCPEKFISNKGMSPVNETRIRSHETTCKRNEATSLVNEPMSAKNESPSTKIHETGSTSPEAISTSHEAVLPSHEKIIPKNKGVPVSQQPQNQYQSQVEVVGIPTRQSFREAASQTDSHELQHPTANVWTDHQTQTSLIASAGSVYSRWASLSDNASKERVIYSLSSSSSLSLSITTNSTETSLMSSWSNVDNTISTETSVMSSCSDDNMVRQNEPCCMCLRNVTPEQEESSSVNTHRYGSAVSDNVSTSFVILPRNSSQSPQLQLSVPASSPSRADPKLFMKTELVAATLNPSESSTLASSSTGIDNVNNLGRSEEPDEALLNQNLLQQPQPSGTASRIPMSDQAMAAHRHRTSMASERERKDVSLNEHEMGLAAVDDQVRKLNFLQHAHTRLQGERMNQPQPSFQASQPSLNFPILAQRSLYPSSQSQPMDNSSQDTCRVGVLESGFHSIHSHQQAFPELGVERTSAYHVQTTSAGHDLQAFNQSHLQHPHDHQGKEFNIQRELTASSQYNLAQAYQGRDLNVHQAKVTVSAQHYGVQPEVSTYENDYREESYPIPQGSLTEYKALLYEPSLLQSRQNDASLLSQTQYTDSCCSAQHHAQELQHSPPYHHPGHADDSDSENLGTDLERNEDLSQEHSENQKH